MKLFNSANVTVPGGLICAGNGLRRVDVPVHYGLIDRGADGLCLVDTGYGPAVTSGPRSLPLRLYNRILRPRLIEGQSPASVLASLGAAPDDVRTIIITHFHADHVAGLREFPRARIIANGAALRAVRGMSERQAIHSGIFTELLPAGIDGRVVPLEDRPLGDTGCETGRGIDGVLGAGHDVFGDGSYWAIPLPGHALGHFGLLWRTSSGPTLYATDAAWSLRALSEDRTSALSRAIVFDDRAAGLRTEVRLRSFLQQGGAVQLCHDLDPS